MRTTTPFKIHDENAGVSIKPGKSGGLKPSTDGPQKKVLQSGVKSTRKGLSTLTASQINTRLATPAHSINMKAKQSTTAKETQKVKFKVAEDFYIDDFQPVRCILLHDRHLHGHSYPFSPSYVINRRKCIARECPQTWIISTCRLGAIRLICQVLSPRMLFLHRTQSSPS